MNLCGLGNTLGDDVVHFIVMETGCTEDDDHGIFNTGVENIMCVLILWQMHFAWE